MRAMTIHQRGDLLAVAILTLMPVLVFGVPAAAGHPLLNGDDLIQNYPLRVLAGHYIGDLRMPQWDPYIWSGSPLLAGWNAGALYPLTGLFAVIGPVAAWAFNEIAVFAVAALGIFAFCRSLHLRPLASFLAALSFGFAGAMSAQVVHIGLIAGVSWIPWMLLALQKIAETRSPWWWVVLLAVAGGMVILAGEPRAISDAAITCLLYAGWLAVTSRRRAVFVAMAVLGGMWGVFIGAIQWVPGLQLLHDSQRSSASYTAFAAGSLPLPWSALLVVPDLLGGSGSFGQPTFMGRYSLTEVTGYVGLLPLVAATALLVRSRWPGSTSHGSRREWSAWYLIGTVGIVLALGANTFLGRLLFHIPLYGGERLQSRNLAIVDLALAMVFAYWVDDVTNADTPVPSGIPDVDESLEGDGLRAAIDARRRALRRQADANRVRQWMGSPTARTASAALPICGILLCLLGLYWGPGFARAFGDMATRALNQHYRQLIPSLVASLVLCIVAAAIGAFHHSMRRQARALLIGVFTIIDIVAFTAMSVTELSANAITHAKEEVAGAIGTSPGGAVSSAVPGSAGASMMPNPPAGNSGGANSSQPQSGSAPATNPSGRYAVYDPDLVNAAGLVQAGQPDLNILRSIPSVQGYGSITPGDYADATGAHGQAVLSPPALDSGAFDALDLTSLYTLPRYLSTPLAGTQTPAAISWQIQPEGVRGWYFGDTLDVAGFEVTDLVEEGLPSGAFAGIQVGLVLPDSTVDWSVDWIADHSGTAFMAKSPPEESIGLEIRDLSPTFPSTVSALIVTTRTGQRIALDGPLAGFLEPGQWSYVSPAYGYQLFERNRPLPMATLTGADGPAGTWSLVRGSMGASAVVRVSTPVPAVFVRSVGYVPGWRATFSTAETPPGVAAPVKSRAVPAPMIQAPAGTAPSFAQPKMVPVSRDGLVQSVPVPAGNWMLSFSYTPPGMATGEAMTLAGVGALTVVLIAAAGRAVLRRRAYPYSTPS